MAFLAFFAQNVDIWYCIQWCCSLGRLWNVCGPVLDSSQACAAKEDENGKRTLVFTCWYIYDPEKDLGAALAPEIFAKQPTAFVLVATWYVVAFWSHNKIVRSFKKCSALERPEEMARIRNDGQMTTRRAVKVHTIPLFLACKRRESSS